MSDKKAFKQEEIILFVQNQTEGWKDAYFSHNISEIAENNARTEFGIRNDEKILALINEAFLEQNIGKSGFVFTDEKICIKPPFRETFSVKYSDFPETPFSFFREKISLNESSSQKDMVSLCQKIKVLAMYGDPDHIKLPSDPTKSPHPVKDWFVFALTFMFFIILVPWLSFSVIGPRVSLPSPVRYLSLISILSWFIWFNSHRAKIKRREKKTLFSIFKRIAYGVFFSAGFLGAVVLDKTRTNPGLNMSSLLPVLGTSLIGAVAFIVLFLLLERFFLLAGHKRKRKIIVRKYLEDLEKEDKNGLIGLLDAGVCDLDDDAEIRKVCYDIANISINPLKEYWDLLQKSDLFDFFQYAKDRGYDFEKWGKPEVIVNKIVTF
ncbi:hypothetical protein JXA84_07905 [candidate division WOR-3 bacterium]|nr:hypothetical protein [candidate division WOR-3 bacterium]